MCTEQYDRIVTGLATKCLQCDEAWGFVGCKDRAKKRGAQGCGSAWVWVAQDADTKLIVSWLVGTRDGEFAEAFMRDVADRIPGRVQVSTDALQSYPSAVIQAFKVPETGETRADLGVVVKVLRTPQPEDLRRYPPSVCIGCTKEANIGSPDPLHTSTSYIERQNRDLRMRCRRMARLSDAFSKTIANHASATALHYWAFNFVKKHATIKTTPAVAAGIALSAYLSAAMNAFPPDRVTGEFPVDLGTVVKTYATPVKEEARRYSPSVCIGCTKEASLGSPDPLHISTSYIERQNRDLRMRCRRMTRLTDGFSKRNEYHASAVASHYWAFSYIKKHATIKTTPAIAAGIADRPLTTLDLAEMIAAAETVCGGRVTGYLASPRSGDAA